MIAVRICKRLEQRIPFLPELDPLVGKMVEMVVMEDPEEYGPEEVAPAAPAPTPEKSPSTESMRGRERVKPMVKSTTKYASREREAAPAPAAAAPAPPPAPPPPPAPRPEPALQRQRVRICGMVDGLSDGGDSFRLVIDPKHAVPCAWASDGPSPAIGAGGWKITVMGTGIFDAAGKLVRVDVKAGAAATQTDLRFARVPVYGETNPEEAQPAASETEVLPTVGAVAQAAAPAEPPRPAFSATTSFREIFGYNNK